MKFCALLTPIAAIFAGCATLPECLPSPSAPSRMILSRGSAFYDSVEYIRLEDNGYVSIRDPEMKKPVYACLQNEDWITIQNLLNEHKAATWKPRYNTSEIPSDGATHIVVEFSDSKVDTYNRMDSAPEDLGLDLVYDGIKSIAIRRNQEAEQGADDQAAAAVDSKP